MLLYVECWLKAPVQMEDSSVVARTAGIPQVGVIPPLLASLFQRYAFDMWMQWELPLLYAARLSKVRDRSRKGDRGGDAPAASDTYVRSL